MSARTLPFDAADYLETPEDIVAFLDEALAMNDPEFFSHALGIVGRAKGMSKLAQDAGLKRASLYRALSATGDPRLSTLFGVIKALGLRLNVQSV